MNTPHRTEPNRRRVDGEPEPIPALAIAAPVGIAIWLVGLIAWGLLG